VATVGSPLYCNPHGEKGRGVGVAAAEGGGELTLPLDCLDTEDLPLEDRIEGVPTGMSADEVVTTPIGGVADAAAAIISCC